MRFKLFISFMILSLLYTGCASVRNLDSPDYRQTRSKAVLGEIGTFKNSLVVDDFEPVGVPDFHRPLRLSVNEKAFSRREYKNFLKSYGKLEEGLNDSLFRIIRPVFFEMEIADKVGYIESVNESKEGKLLDYLLRTEDNLAITGIKITYPDLLRDKIRKASEIYLVDLDALAFGLKIINKDKTSEIIDFSEGTGMGYVFSAICWTKNYKGDYLIGALTKPGGSCPGETKNKSRKLYEKDIFEKL